MTDEESGGPIAMKTMPEASMMMTPLAGTAIGGNMQSLIASVFRPAELEKEKGGGHGMNMKAAYKDAAMRGFDWAVDHITETFYEGGDFTKELLSKQAIRGDAQKMATIDAISVINIIANSMASDLGDKELMERAEKVNATIQILQDTVFGTKAGEFDTGRFDRMELSGGATAEKIADELGSRKDTVVDTLGFSEENGLLSDKKLFESRDSVFRLEAQAEAMPEMAPMAMAGIGEVSMGGIAAETEASPEVEVEEHMTPGEEEVGIEGEVAPKEEEVMVEEEEKAEAPTAEEMIEKKKAEMEAKEAESGIYAPHEITIGGEELKAGTEVTPEAEVKETLEELSKGHIMEKAAAREKSSGVYNAFEGTIEPDLSPILDKTFEPLPSILEVTGESFVPLEEAPEAFGFAEVAGGVNDVLDDLGLISTILGPRGGQGEPVLLPRLEYGAVMSEFKKEIKALGKLYDQLTADVEGTVGDIDPAKVRDLADEMNRHRERIAETGLQERIDELMGAYELGLDGPNGKLYGKAYKLLGELSGRLADIDAVLGRADVQVAASITAAA